MQSYKIQALSAILWILLCEGMKVFPQGHACQQHSDDTETNTQHISRAWKRKCIEQRGVCTMNNQMS